MFEAMCIQIFTVLCEPFSLATSETQYLWLSLAIVNQHRTFSKQNQNFQWRPESTDTFESIPQSSEENCASRHGHSSYNYSRADDISELGCSNFVWFSPNAYIPWCYGRLIQGIYTMTRTLNMTLATHGTFWLVSNIRRGSCRATGSGHELSLNDRGWGRK